MAKVVADGVAAGRSKVTTAEMEAPAPEPAADEPPAEAAPEPAAEAELEPATVAAEGGETE